MDANYISLYNDIYNFQAYPPRWMREISIKAYEGSHYHESGCINGFWINYRQILREKGNLYQVFSAIDEHAATACQTFFQPGIHQAEGIQSIYYIKELFIHEDKRNHGIGSHILGQLPEYLTNLTHTPVSHLFLVPFPLSRNRYGTIVPDPNKTDKIPLLKKFYEKNGFVEMNTGETGLRYLWTQDDFSCWLFTVG